MRWFGLGHIGATLSERHLVVAFLCIIGLDGPHYLTYHKKLL